MHIHARYGVVEAEFEGMKGQASKGIDVLQAIASVTNNGVPQVLHMYADLVLASCFEVQFHQRIAVSASDGAIVRDGFFTSIIHGA